MRGGLQGRIAVASFAAAAIVLLLYLQLGQLGLYWVYKQSPTTAEEALQLTKELLVTLFFVLAAGTVAFAYWVGRTFFRVAGPVYRFRKFFDSLAQGRWDVPCTLRGGDHLQELKDGINSCLAQMVDRLRSQHDALSEARDVIERLPQLPQEERIQSLLARMDAEAAEYGHRIGEGTAVAAESQPEAASEREPVETS